MSTYQRKPPCTAKPSRVHGGAYRLWLAGIAAAALALLMLLPAGAALTPTPVAVDDRVTVSFGGLRYNRSGNTYDSAATLTNHSAEPISIPLQLAVPSVTPTGVTLANAAGTLNSGATYVNVNPSDGVLDPGETVANVMLKFNNPSRVNFTFTHSVLGIIPEANHAPLADAGQDQSALVGSLVALDGSRSSDQDGDPLTYR
jgi:hypothetical protein